MRAISFRNDVLPLKDILYRLALRITLSQQDAEDIVQETMIKVWNKRDTWSEIESMEAYCLTICRNIALDHQKKKDNQSLSLDPMELDRPDDSSNSPFTTTLMNDRVSIVRRLVDSLPEKQRSCMQLRDFEGKPYKEIAQILGITEEQVKVNIFRARQTIKQRFTETENYGL